MILHKWFSDARSSTTDGVDRVGNVTMRILEVLADIRIVRPQIGPTDDHDGDKVENAVDAMGELSPPSAGTQSPLKLILILNHRTGTK